MVTSDPAVVRHGSEPVLSGGHNDEYDAEILHIPGKFIVNQMKREEI